MNMKINLALVAMALSSVLAGCGNISTTADSQARALSSAKTDTGIVYGQATYGWPQSIATVCKKPSAVGDERCSRQGEYMATVANLRVGGRGFGAINAVQVFALKSDHVESGDILKIRLQGSAPAIVLAVASKGNSPDCGFVRGFPNGGRVVCNGFDANN